MIAEKEHDNDIRAGQWVALIYDGTNMQMQSVLGNVFLTTAVTSIATISPITGGTITSTGTIACAPCVVASSLALAAPYPPRLAALIVGKYP